MSRDDRVRPTDEPDTIPIQRRHLGASAPVSPNLPDSALGAIDWTVRGLAAVVALSLTISGCAALFQGWGSGIYAVRTLLGALLLLTLAALAVWTTSLVPERRAIDPASALALGMGTAWSGVAFTAGSGPNGWAVFVAVVLTGVAVLRLSTSSAAPGVPPARSALDLTALPWTAALAALTAFYTVTSAADMTYAAPFVVAGALHLALSAFAYGVRGRLRAGDRRARVAVAVAAGVAVIACSLAGDGFAGGWAVAGLLAAVTASCYLLSEARQRFGESPIDLPALVGGLSARGTGGGVRHRTVNRTIIGFGVGIVAVLLLSSVIAGVRDGSTERQASSTLTSTDRPATPRATNRPLPFGVPVFADCDRGSTDVRLLFGPADAFVQIVVDGTTVNDGRLGTKFETRGATNTVDNVGAEVTGLCNSNVPVHMTVRTTSGQATCSLEESTYRSPDPPVRNSGAGTATCDAVLTGSRSSAESSPSPYGPPAANATIPACHAGESSMPLMVTYTGESSGIDDKSTPIDQYMTLAEDVYVSRTVSATVGAPTRFDVPCRASRFELSAFYNGQWVLSSPTGTVLASPSETPSDLYVDVQH